MPLESASFVNQLDQTKPTSTDVKSEGDDVMRLIKSTLKNSFPNVGGAMTASHTELNRVTGVTEDVQPRLSATLSAPNGETLNRLPAAASRLGGFLLFNASTGQPEVSFSLATASGNSLGIFSVSNVTTFFTAGAERMRVSADGLGVGATAFGYSAAGRNIVAINGATTSFLELQTGGVSRGYVGASATGVEVGATGAFTVVTGGNERFRMSSAGEAAFGASPIRSGRVEILGKTNTTGAQSNSSDYALQVSNTANTEYMGITHSAIAVVSPNPLTLATSNLERVRISAGGDVISNVNTSAPTLTTNQQMVFALTSNTNLRVSVRGTDGVTRVTNLTLA